MSTGVQAPQGRAVAVPRIRLATGADAAMLAVLRYELRTGIAPDVAPEAGFHERCTEWMASRLPWTDVWRCWLGEDEGGEPLGTVWLQFMEKLPNPVGEPGLHAYLTGFYVRERRGTAGWGRHCSTPRSARARSEASTPCSCGPRRGAGGCISGTGSPSSPVS
jgi:hypothetical protein